jgi:hypothetical protein
VTLAVVHSKISTTEMAFAAFIFAILILNLVAVLRIIKRAGYSKAWIIIPALPVALTTAIVVEEILTFKKLSAQRLIPPASYKTIVELVHGDIAAIVLCWLLFMAFAFLTWPVVRGDFAFRKRSGALDAPVVDASQDRAARVAAIQAAAARQAAAEAAVAVAVAVGTEAVPDAQVLAPAQGFGARPTASVGAAQPAAWSASSASEATDNYWTSRTGRTLASA